MPGFGRLDIPDKSGPLHGVAPPFKIVEIHQFKASEDKREDRGRGRELDVRSKSGIAPSSSG